MKMLRALDLARGIFIAVMGWQLLQPTNLAAGPTEAAWNFDRAGIGTIPDGRLDLASFSKLAPWPYTDGDYLYAGCYDPSPLDTARPAPDRCFMTIDASDPTTPVRLATVPTFDHVASPSPPSATPFGRGPILSPIYR